VEHTTHGTSSVGLRSEWTLVHSHRGARETSLKCWVTSEPVC